MGLMPLEYSDCVTDSPYFRQKLQAHEKELDRTSHAIKNLTKEVKDLISAAKGMHVTSTVIINLAGPLVVLICISVYFSSITPFYV